MRHGADAMPERLVLSFIHDRLIELDRPYVARVRISIDASPGAARRVAGTSECV